MTSTFHMRFKNESSDRYDLYIVRRPNIPAAEPIYEPYEIPGHDGILMPVDIRYGPIEIDVEMNFMSSDPLAWGNAYRAAKNWLTGSGSLSFSDDHNWYYHVYMASIVESERTSRRIGSFTAHFVCEPYCYYWTGGDDIEITENYISLENQYPITAKPRFEIRQAGIRGTVEILVRRGESTKQFSIETGDHYNYYKIDCEKGLIIAQSSEYNPASATIWNKHASGNFEDLYIPKGEIEFARRWTPKSEGTVLLYTHVYPLWRSL